MSVHSSIQDPVVGSVEHHSEFELLMMKPNSEQIVSPKELKASSCPPRAPRIIITTLFIFFGVTLLLLPMLTFMLSQTAYADSGPCPETTAFSIDIAVVTLTYDSVKIIDAVWNLAVGRGLQAFSAWVCYKVFGMALLRITQQTPVSVDLYAALSFHPLDVTTLPKLVQALSSKCGWRGRATFTWFIIAIVHVLALPTLLDFTTGYISDSKAMIAGPNGTLTPLTSSYNYRTPDGSGWIYGSTGITCVPGKAYTWGFSTIWVWIVVYLVDVWCWGMFGVWFDAQRHSTLWRKGRRPGLYRDIVDLSNTFQDVLGPKIHSYSNDKLTREVSNMTAVGFEEVDGEARLCHRTIHNSGTPV